MNSDRHIVSAFDRDLEAVQALVVKMGGMVEAAICDAAIALETRDEDLAEEVRRRDQAIDALEAQVNHEAVRLIALRSPRATDLRIVLSVIKIAAALERVGDYAKNIAKRSHVLIHMPQIEGSGAALHYVRHGRADAEGRARQLHPPRRRAGGRCPRPRCRGGPDV